MCSSSSRSVLTLRTFKRESIRRRKVFIRLESGDSVPVIESAADELWV